jgi:hypothetical protein
MGPCEGKFSADLLASRSESVLQVKLGDARARLIDSPSQQLQPDKIAPPLPIERTSALRSSLPSPINAFNSDLEIAIVVEKKMNAITWGRWQYLVNIEPASTLEEVQKRIGGEMPLTSGIYAMGRTTAGDLTLPRDGKFSFALKGSEAFILNYNTGRAESASVRDGSLTVDFDRRNFETKLDLSGESGAVMVQGRGNITRDGQMVGDLIGSNASIDGLLAGQDARQAGYVFSKPVDLRGLSAYGATYWSR